MLQPSQALGIGSFTSVLGIFGLTRIEDAETIQGVVSPPILLLVGIYCLVVGVRDLVRMDSPSRAAKCLEALSGPPVVVGVLTIWLFWAEDSLFKTSLTELWQRWPIAAAGAALIVVGALLYVLSKKVGAPQ